MAYKGGRNGKSGRGRSSRYRKRTGGAVQKVYRQRPTAYNQRRQIARVTRLALANRKRFNTCYTDYALTQDGTTPSYAVVLSAGSWLIQPLTDFSTWLPVLRQDTNVNEASHTFVKRLQLDVNLFATGYVNCSCFVVRMRGSNAERDLLASPPTEAGGDFIDSSHPNIGTDVNGVRLNAGKFKVLAHRYFTMNTVAYGTSSAVNEDSMRRHWCVTLNPRIKVSQMSASSGVPLTWRNKQFMQLPYYDRLYLAILPGFSPSTTPAPTAQAQYNQLATCINTL